jgi:hypothetical protein
MSAHHPGCRLHAEACIAPSGLEGRDHFEADIAFTCAPADHDLRGIVSEPLLVVEILPPSAERDEHLRQAAGLSKHRQPARCPTSKARGPSPRSIAEAARAGRRARSTAPMPAYSSKRSGSISPSPRSIAVFRGHKPVHGLWPDNGGGGEHRAITPGTASRLTRSASAAPPPYGYVSSMVDFVDHPLNQCCVRPGTSAIRAVNVALSSSYTTAPSRFSPGISGCGAPIRKLEAGDQI